MPIEENIIKLQTILGINEGSFEIYKHDNAFKVIIPNTLKARLTVKELITILINYPSDTPVDALGVMESNLNDPSRALLTIMSTKYNHNTIRQELKDFLESLSKNEFQELMKEIKINIGDKSFVDLFPIFM